MMLAALSVLTVASYLFTFLHLEWPLSWIVWLVVLRFGCGSFVYTPLLAVALSHLPPEKVRMGSGLLNLMQNGLGNTLGLALVTTVLARRLTYHHSTLDQQQDFSSLSWGECLLRCTSWCSRLARPDSQKTCRSWRWSVAISNSRSAWRPIKTASCW